MKILIIGGDAQDSKNMRHAFEQRGYDEVSICATLSEGIKKAEFGKANLVIINNTLPDANGLDACKRIKIASGGQAKVVIVADAVNTREAVEARKAGADDYTAKGLTYKELIDCVKNFERGGEQIKALKGLRVLIVDDDVVSQKLLVSLLKERAFEVDIASNGQEAVEKVKQNDYDLCLMDIKMPVMDGYQATEAIREQGNTTLPVIALTIVVIDEGMGKALAVGLNDYLTKPINVEELEQKIIKWAPKG